MDFIKALFRELEEPVMHIEHEIAGKDNYQEPQGKNSEVQDRAPA